MATTTTIATPLGRSIVRARPIFRNLREKWGTVPQNANPRRFARLLLPPPPHLPPLFPRCLPIRHRTRRSLPPFRPLLRPRPPPFSPPMCSMTAADSNHIKTVRVVVKGRVQGVFYRIWTVENAMELGLKGWVRNRRDGSVEAIFSGSADKVQEMEQRCRRGPPEASVTGLEVFPSTDDPGTGFERRATV